MKETPKATDEKTEAVPAPLDLDASPFEPQAIAGLPFSKDSEEALAIREVIERADRRRAASKREA